MTDHRPDPVELGKDTSPVRKALVLIGLLAWVALMVTSIVAWLDEPPPNVIVTGLGTFIAFLGWQWIAALLATILWWLSSGLPQGTILRYLARVPGW
ncbi:hypothetical protein [Gymnodinialimonas hymeniacidonis]|uniref:hypothetical protein n=1 Tax=Gymnodinialimonas hymeniacidonis TaxID=3126508 RepID=UPI0034C692F3